MFLCQKKVRQSVSIQFDGCDESSRITNTEIERRNLKNGYDYRSAKRCLEGNLFAGIIYDWLGLSNDELRLQLCSGTYTYERNKEVYIRYLHGINSNVYVRDSSISLLVAYPV